MLLVFFPFFPLLIPFLSWLSIFRFLTLHLWSYPPPRTLALFISQLSDEWYRQHFRELSEWLLTLWSGKRKKRRSSKLQVVVSDLLLVKLHPISVFEIRSEVKHFRQQCELFVRNRNWKKIEKENGKKKKDGPENVLNERKLNGKREKDVFKERKFISFIVSIKWYLKKWRKEAKEEKIEFMKRVSLFQSLSLPPNSDDVTQGRKEKRFSICNNKSLVSNHLITFFLTTVNWNKKKQKLTSTVTKSFEKKKGKWKWCINYLRLVQMEGKFGDVRFVVMVRGSRIWGSWRMLETKRWWSMEEGSRREGDDDADNVDEDEDDDNVSVFGWEGNRQTLQSIKYRRV